MRNALSIAAFLLFALASPAHPDACTDCHKNATGLGPYHDPAAIGCAACHGGDGAARDAKAAHAGMRLIPGQSADAALSCGASGCHSEAHAKMEANLMSTMAGVVALDRKAFGDATTLPAHVRRLGRSPADDHLRTLCASCHLGNVKEAWGPVGQTSRGGGCNACHLVYDGAATRALAAYRKTRGSGKPPPAAHPALTVNVSDEHCFGCHSRSGRIALSYRGWAEILGAPPKGAKTSRLEDGRRVAHLRPDVHAARMQCIDCHTQGEVMGDGRAHATKEEALDVACADCHTAAPVTKTIDQLTPEEQRSVIVRGRSLDVTFVATRNSGAALVGTEVSPAGVYVRTKAKNALLAARPPAAACEDAAHTRLACEACHSAWAPQCFQCHTRFAPGEEGYDLLENAPKKGDWLETPGDYRATPPTLGVRKRATTGSEEVTTFVPGMIFVLEKGMGHRPTFQRFFGPLTPHTVSRESRSCASCHQSPDALGYGSGLLRYRADNGRGRWTLAPRARTLADGLPADAWIAFGRAVSGPTLRSNTRPFDRVEQQRVLRAGACLTCHAPASAVMQAYLRDPAGRRSVVDPRCVAPED